MASYRGIVAGLAVCLLGVAALPLVAQQAPGAAPGGDANPPRQRGNGGGNGGGDRMAQMRERMTTRLKEALGCTDEEFKAIQPKLEKVMQLRMQSMIGGFGGMRRGGPGGQGGPGGNTGPGGGNDVATPNQPANPVGDAVQELNKVLENKDAKAEEIQAKLKAVREAKKTAKEALTKAQDELRELLTVRQEAQMVANGILE
ncbi:MAG: hypothetical protein WCJ97_07700 [Phycisphaerae bacterium]